MVADCEVIRGVCLDFYHILSLRVVWCFCKRGVELGGYQPESRKIRLTETVEMMLFARLSGGSPPPITVDGRSYMRVAGRSGAAGRSRLDHSGSSARLITLPVGQHPKLK